MPPLFYSELVHVLARKSGRDLAFVEASLELILHLGIRTLALSDRALSRTPYWGVIVLASARMARSIAASIPDIRIPQTIIDKLEDDPDVGVDIALDQIDQIKDSGAFDGIRYTTPA